MATPQISTIQQLGRVFSRETVAKALTYYNDTVYIEKIQVTPKSAIQYRYIVLSGDVPQIVSRVLHSTIEICQDRVKEVLRQRGDKVSF